MSKLEKDKSVSFLKKKLWKLFSKYIRERDKYTCFTCGKIADGSGMHAGHFITGATCPTELYFSETNVHAQCYHCNINLSGNWVIYEQKMLTKYGLETIDTLKKSRFVIDKKDWSWYHEKIAYYEGLSTGL
jgi:hypothetical protein